MIVKSELFQDNHTQIDGTRWVGEIHTDDQGVEYRFDYLATPEMMDNREKVMADRAIDLAEQVVKQREDDRKGALSDSASDKLGTYLRGRPDAELKSVGLTDDEVAVFKGSEEVRPTRTVNRGR